MLYANENRKKMSQLYPTESNKDISKRLGNGWKSLNDTERKKFFERAKVIGLQHKKEYPVVGLQIDANQLKPSKSLMETERRRGATPTGDSRSRVSNRITQGDRYVASSSFFPLASLR